jgi:carbohydrate diacid regulator
MLTREIANQIVHETMTRLHRNINIIDHTGTIIASGDSSRLGEIHGGALEVLRTGKPLFITEASQQKYKGVRPGINLPIEFQDRIIGVIGITGQPEEIREFGELVKMITEMMIRQSVFAAQMEGKQRMKEMIFEELINLEPDYESAERRLHLLEMKLLPPFQVCLIEMRDIPLPNQELIQKVEAILHGNQFLVGFSSVNRLFILTSGHAERVVKRKLEAIRAMLEHMGIPGKIGVGSPVMDPAQIRLSMDEAKLALWLGHDKQVITSYLDVEIKVLMNRIDPQVKQKFVDRVFANVPKYTRETLLTFFEQNLNIGETAKQLNLHRNTLSYRLRKIKEETGYDPQVFQEAVTLQMALWIQETQR